MEIQGLQKKRLFDFDFIAQSRKLLCEDCLIDGFEQSGTNLPVDRHGDSNDVAANLVDRLHQMASASSAPPRELKIHSPSNP